ncbi:MAG: hypothetical protein CMM58_03855 [Rhodospirillaceae bacterium]|mgnify:CR=1 FL=1|nr:hypothetical protein [Rhodospirillaceae bacterium]|tara:strand:- start:1235 stop:2452 length:1218 start_codon:yes stop_codon:yes gene_type:complete
MDLQKTLKTAISYHNANSLSEAENLYREILKFSPRNPMASVLLAKICLREERVSGIGELLLDVISENPEYMQAYNVAGDYHLQMGDEKKANLAYRKSLLLQPDQSAPFVSIANMMQQVSSKSDKDEYAILFKYRQALISKPSSTAAINNVAAMQLKMLNPKGALDTLAASEEITFNNVRSIAYKTIALLGVNRISEANKLIGLGTLIRAQYIDIHEMNYNIVTFNNELRSALLKHPNFTSDWNPQNRAIRGGAIVPRLFDHQVPILELFKAALVTSINKYISSLPEDPDHPYLRLKPKAYSLDIWANFLGPADHQSGHIHNQGWMSGVYYVTMPPKNKAQESFEGWIEFNRPGYGLPALGDKKKYIRSIEPHPGMIIMFPSYVWHGTVPFSTRGDRVSIAFDVHL